VAGWPGTSRICGRRHDRAVFAVEQFLLLALLVTFLIGAVVKKVNAYEAFIEGAKEGFNTAVTIIPYLVAMLVAIAMLRASGVLPAFVDAVRAGVLAVGFDAAGWMACRPC